MNKKLLLIPAFVMILALVPASSSALKSQARVQVVPETEEQETPPEGTNLNNGVKAQVSEDEEIEDVTKNKEEKIERIAQKALHAIDSAIRRYERVRLQVEKSSLKEGQKEQVLATVEAQIQSMNTLRNQVKIAETAEEVKNVMTQLQTKFRYSLGLVRQAVKGVYEDRLENISEKINLVYEKIASKVSELSESDSKDELMALLAEARILIDSADAKLESGDLEGAASDYQSAHSTLHEIVVILNEGV